MTEAAVGDVWRPAVTTAVVTLGLGTLAAMLGAWAVAQVTSPLDLLKYGALTWLVGVGSSLRLDGDVLGTLPIGLTGIFVLITYLVARWQTRGSSIPASVFTASTAGVAGVLSAIAAVVISGDAVAVSMVRSAFGAFIVVGLGVGLAAYRRPGQRWFGLQERWWPVADGAATAAIAFIGVSTLVTLVSLMLSVEQSATMWASVGPGAEAPLLGLLMVLGFPTAVTWTMALLLGPGFAVGEGTHVDVAGSSVEHLPAIPLLAGIPEPGPHPMWMFVLAAVPLVCGLLAGWWTQRRSAADVEWQRSVGDGALAGAAAGLVLGVLMAVSAGGVGPGTLQVAGPIWWLPGLIAVGVLSLGAALGAGLSYYRGVRGRS